MKNYYENFANIAAKAIGFEKTDIESGDNALKNLFANSFYGGE